MKRHPNKEIQAAIDFALVYGWRFIPSRGHAFGRLKCSKGHRQHQLSVWSTPKNPKAHAQRIVKQVMVCEESI
ncbi:MAG: hypothetical protein CMF19_04765 [Idiomarinaceae bacterium]|nr:hypothetical protein [Idiomarinaceae bacterium]